MKASKIELSVFASTLTLASTLALAPTASAQEHFDALLTRDTANPGFMPTGEFDFDGFALQTLPQVEIYGNDLEEPVPGADLYVGEAGFFAPAASFAPTILGGTGLTQLPGGVDVRFDFRAFNLYGGGTFSNLWYWDGVDDDGDSDFANNIDFAPAFGVTLSLERAGVFSASVDGANVDVNGFVIDTTALDNPGTADDETGFMHNDLDALLDDADNDPLTAIPTGVYVLGTVISDDAANSALLYWVFAVGADEAAHAAAIDYVPEPTSALALLAGVALLAPRRGA